MPSGVVVIGLYVIFATLGSLGAWAIGLAVEARTSQAVSLIVFLAVFFAALILAWPVAARLTEALIGKDPVPDEGGRKNTPVS
jgi:membrane protein implicated in regulation of membrane protease activity